MKKFLALTLVVLAIVFALASCGGQEIVNTTTTTQKVNPEPPVHTHNYDEWKTVKNPTCTENGEEVRYCSCGEKQSEVIPALGHKRAEAVEENRVEATCYAVGSYDMVVYCSECKAELERATFTLSKVEHTPANAVEENRVNPTHEKDGSYQMVVYCSVAECQAELERTTHTFDMLVHHPGNTVIENEVAATCTSNGSYDEVVYCLDDDCGHKELSRKTVSVPMVAHTPAEAVEENRVDATCTANGSYDEVVYCVNCRAQMSRTTKTIDALGHSEVIDSAVEPTCTETGLTEGKHCSVCGETLVAQIVVAEKGHTESDWIVDVEPTTTTEGSKHTECTVCGEKIRTEVIATTTSKGLKYTLNNDEQSYSVTGMGTCTDTDVVIPSMYNGKFVTYIGKQAFSYCSFIMSIKIPDSVKNISSDAFCYCLNLTSILVDENNEFYQSIDGNLYTKDGKKLVKCARDKNSISIEIPNSVTSIGAYAFQGCYSLTSIEIPESVTSIGNYAFPDCTSLISIEIPNSVTSIGAGAFSGCTSLTSIEIPDSVTSIGASAFSRCKSLTSIVIPNSVTGIDAETFYGCESLTSIKIPDSVTSIGVGAFSRCTSLTSIEIPNSITSIGACAFIWCTSLTQVKLPQYINWIDEELFLGCTSIETINIPNSVQTIGYRAFCDCTSLKNIELPSSITYIGSYAFQNCTSITTIVLPNSITSMGVSVFSGCSSLESMTIPFVGCSKTAPIANFGEIFGSDEYEGATQITQYYGSDSYAFKNYYIPDSLKSVTVTGGNLLYGAFYNCSMITSIDLGEVTSIGDYAFYGCHSLTRMQIPNSVISMGFGTFMSCYKLKIIYCEANSRPSGWNSSWNYSGYPVVWGYKPEQ